MNLREWMFRHNVSNVALAKALRTSAPYVSLLKHKKINPNRKRAIEIVKFTNQAVPLEEFGYCEIGGHNVDTNA